MREHNSIRNLFSLRSLFALTAGFAVVALVSKFLVSMGWPLHRVGLVLSPWALGSIGGIVRSVRHRRSTTLPGAIVGGIVGLLFFPIIPMLYRLFNGQNQIEELPIVLFQILAFGICGSSLLSAVFGTVREGITLSRRRAENHAVQGPRGNQI